MRRRQRQDLSEHARDRRYSAARRERSSEPEPQDDVLEDLDAIDDEMDDDVSMMYEDADLSEASLDELQELADELGVPDYDEMDRGELVREIRGRL